MNNIHNTKKNLISILQDKANKDDVLLRFRSNVFPDGSIKLNIKKAKSIHSVIYKRWEIPVDNKIGKLHFIVRQSNTAANISDHNKRIEMITINENDSVLAFADKIYNHLISGPPVDETIGLIKVKINTTLPLSKDEVSMSKVLSVNFGSNPAVNDKVDVLIKHEFGEYITSVDKIWGIEQISTDHYIFINNKNDACIMKKDKAIYYFDMAEYFNMKGN